MQSDNMNQNAKLKCITNKCKRETIIRGSPKHGLHSPRIVNLFIILSHKESYDSAAHPLQLFSFSTRSLS